MSTFGSEEELLAELMGQGEAAKAISGVRESSVGHEGDATDDIPLRTRAH